MIRTTVLATAMLAASQSAVAGAVANAPVGVSSLSSVSFVSIESGAAIHSIAANHSIAATSAAPTIDSTTATMTARSKSKAKLSPVIAQNATASNSPIRATTPANVNSEEKSAAPFRPKIALKARIDDGRYSGFHQGGGDQPAGDQQFRPADRIPTENKRLSRKSGERTPTPAQPGSTPALRDQSTIVRTQ